MTTHTPVAIIGSGPTGLMLANLLGAQGVGVILIERHLTTVQEPRAVSIDDESLRSVQAAGAIETVLREVVPGYGSHYHGPDGSCFAKVEPTGTPFGYPRRNAFRQPVLEQQLRDNLARYPCVETRYGWRVTGFEDEGLPDGGLPDGRSKGVTVCLADAGAAAHVITCDYLVGCDGASSATREALGIALGGTTFDERWLIVDLENSRNAVKHTKVFCDTSRPCITLPGPQDTRRFEFKLLADERDEDLLDPGKVAALLASHGADPAATIRRKVVYHFHARVADQWSRGAVFLAGDAVHLTPPFAGQGMNSGIRDAHNLAWKLAAVLRGVAGPGLLDTYVQERRDHVWAMIRLALRMGAVMSPRSRAAGFFTRAAFRALRIWPPASDYVLQMKYKPKPRFTHGFLLPAGKAAPGLVGRLFPQPSVQTADGRVVLLDVVLGVEFCLLGCDAAVLAALRHPVWERLGTRRVAVQAAGASAAVGVTCVTEPGGSVQAVLGDGAVLLLRPDHYVAAAFLPADADAAAGAMQALLDATWSAAGSASGSASAPVASAPKAIKDLQPHDA